MNVSRKLSSSLLKCLINSNNNGQICSLSTTSTSHSFYKFWREKRNMTRCGNEYGPLTDLPDWSYMDGRPAPLGSKQKARHLKQVELTKKVVNMLNEVEFAINHHKAKEEDKHNDLRLRLETKLKQKGGFVKTTKKLK